MAARRITGPPAGRAKYEEIYDRPANLGTRAEAPPPEVPVDAGTMAPYGNRLTPTAAAALPDYAAQPAVDDGDVDDAEAALRRMEARLAERAEAVRCLSDAGPHDPANYFAEGDAMHARWAAEEKKRLETRDALAAAEADRAIWAVERQVFLGELAAHLHMFLLYDVVDAVVGLANTRALERQEAEDAAVEAWNLREDAARAARRDAEAAAAAAQRRALDDSAVASSDPAIAAMRRAARDRLTAQDAAAAAAEEEELQRLTLRAEALSQSRIPRAPSPPRRPAADGHRSMNARGETPPVDGASPQASFDDAPSAPESGADRLAAAQAAELAALEGVLKRFRVGPSLGGSVYNVDAAPPPPEEAELARREDARRREEAQEARRRIVSTCVAQSKAPALVAAEEAVAATMPRAGPGPSVTIVSSQHFLTEDSPAKRPVPTPPAAVFVPSSRTPVHHTSHEFISTKELD